MRDGLEVALDIVGELRDHVRPDRERTDTAEQQRVAVGLRLCDRVIADDESAACIYQTRGGPENLRWFWSLTVNGPMTRSGRVATLDEAKAQLQTSWDA